MADELELAIRRVQEAMDRVVAAWEAERPEALTGPEWPSPPAWHPDPNQAPVITRQRAELTRLRATRLCQTGHRVYEQAKRLHQSAQELHALLHRPGEAPRADANQPTGARADASRT